MEIIGSVSHGHLRRVSHGAEDGLEMSSTQHYGHFRHLICFWISTGLSSLGIYSCHEVVSYCPEGLSACAPTASTKVVFISILMTFLAPCWVILSVGETYAAFTACFTLGTLEIGSVAVTFPVFEGTYFIYNCCCWNSTV